MPHGNIAIAQVAILMCTKDGAAFIDDQLKSIADQTHENWMLIVSDDGSSDETVAKLERFAETHRQKTMIRKGPGRGVCANFLSLANDPTIDADYFAFSDQDDIWNQEKLRRALAWLASVPADVPGMYCGRTELMTIDERSYGLSPLFTRSPAFENALVQSLGGGNTIIFNRAAKKILEEAATIDVVLHDWWVYQLVSAAGGMVHYDPRPMVKYRQHPDNLIGSNISWRRAPSSPAYDAERTFSRLEQNEHHRAPATACSFATTTKSRGPRALRESAVRVPPETSVLS